MNTTCESAVPGDLCDVVEVSTVGGGFGVDNEDTKEYNEETKEWKKCSFNPYGDNSYHLQLVK